MYVCVYVCMYACMHGWMDGCKYIYIYIFILKNIHTVVSVPIKSVHDFPLLAELECLSIQVWDAPLWHITHPFGNPNMQRRFAKWCFLTFIREGLCWWFEVSRHSKT